MEARLKLDWRAAFSFVSKGEGWRSKCFLGGLWIFLLPPIGWLMALGYRKEVVLRLIDDRNPIMPEWSQWRQFLGDGCKAAGVIFSYYLPFMLVFWLAAAPNLNALSEHWLSVLLFFMLVPLCIPLCVPGSPTLFVSCFFCPKWHHIRCQEEN